MKTVIKLFLFSVFSVSVASVRGQTLTDTSGPKSTTLKEVIIYDKEINRINPDSIIIINPVSNILSHIEGVSLIRRGNFAPEPVISGMTMGRINMTIDGMRIFGACPDKMDPVNTYLEPNNLESISVSYQPDGNTMGSTVGGGFDFKLKEANLANTASWSGQIGSRYQTNGNAVQTTGAIKYNSPEWAILVNGSYRQSGDYRAADRVKIPFSQYQKWNGNAAVKHALNKHQSLSLDYIQDETYNTGYPGLTMDVKYARTKIGSFSWLYQDNGKKLSYLQAKIYANVIHHAMDDSKRPRSQTPMHMDMSGKSITCGGFLVAHWKVNKFNRLIAKAEVYQNNLHAEMTMYPESGTPAFMLTIPDGIRRVADINLTDDVLLNDRWQMEIGGNLSYNNSAIESELGKEQMTAIYSGEPNTRHLLWNAFGTLKYFPARRLSFDFNLSRGMREPTLREYYSVDIFNPLDNYDYIGNPALQVEASYNTALSANFKNNWLQVNGRIYYNFIQNYIAGTIADGYTPMTHGATGVKRYANLSSANIYGASLKLNIQPVQHLELRSQNTYSYGSDPQNRGLPSIPPFQSINSINTGWKKWGAFLEAITNAPKRHISSFYGDVPAPAFTLFNFHISKAFDFSKNKLNAGFSVENIFDSFYYEALDVLQVPRPGRNFVVSITFNFS